MATVATAAAAGDTASASAVSGPAPTRLLSLDAFRGVTIAGMLLVNNPGSWSAIHPPLRHAEWHGWTPTDLIFPFFLFIVGVAMVFSFAARMRRGDDRRALMLNATRRAAILFALGLLLHGFPNYLDLANLRIPGVLQRIGLAYFAATAIVLYLGRNGQVIATAVLLLGYWAVMTLVPVPGGSAGVLQPGLDVGAYIDRAVFGEAHLWTTARTWDPEGLLSTVPAIATVLLGVFAGSWLRADRDPATRAVGLFLAGNAGLVLGLIWHPLFPINKSLWTSSYVVFTAGMACHFLAVCYWLIDVKGYRRWAKPFVIFGVNAIAAFFLSGLFARLLTMIPVAGTTLKGFIHGTFFTPVLSPTNASLAFAISFVLLWLGIMTVLYRRRIFIKI
ncbi:MAG: acyltransferase family protein [Longimicrobiales bacterium]